MSLQGVLGIQNVMGPLKKEPCTSTLNSALLLWVMRGKSWVIIDDSSKEHETTLGNMNLIFFCFFFHFFTKMQFSQGLLGVKISQIELQRKKKVKNLGNTIFRVVYVFDKPVFWPFLFAPKFLRRSFCFGFSVQHEAILFFAIHARILVFEVFNMDQKMAKKRDLCERKQLLSGQLNLPYPFNSIYLITWYII